MAEFLPPNRQRIVSAITQKPMRLICPAGHCDMSWDSNVPNKLINLHVRDSHPEIWKEWIGWLADMAELNGMFELQDDR